MQLRDDHLPGLLRSNNVVMSQIKERFFPPAMINYAQNIGEMFDALNDGNTHGAEWRADGAYCDSCLDVFIAQRLYSWFINRLVKG